MKITTLIRVAIIRLAIITAIMAGAMKVPAQAFSTALTKAPTEWGDTTAGLRIALQLEQKKTKLQDGKSSEVILATITIENVSDQDINVPMSNPEVTFQFDIKDKNGKGVPMTDWGKRHQDATRMTGMGIESGKHTSFKINLGRSYDLSNLNTYSVSVTMRVHQLATQAIPKVSEEYTNLSSNIAKLIVKAMQP